MSALSLFLKAHVGFPLKAERRKHRTETQISATMAIHELRKCNCSPRPGPGQGGEGKKEVCLQTRFRDVEQN